jgi:hypothetical protein
MCQEYCVIVIDDSHIIIVYDFLMPLIKLNFQKDNSIINNHHYTAEHDNYSYHLKRNII